MAAEAQPRTVVWKRSPEGNAVGIFAGLVQPVFPEGLAGTQQGNSDCSRISAVGAEAVESPRQWARSSCLRRRPALFGSPYVVPTERYEHTLAVIAGANSPV